ncbi:DMT family transporter, partial [Bifidobacterium adolescentis]
SMAWARWDIVLCIAYLVIGSTVIAQVFQTIAIQNLPTSEASVILSTECIFAMLVSVIFTGETLTVPSLCGFALIFGAILLSEIQLPSAKRQRGTTEGD